MEKLTIIAGPCVIESQKQLEKIASDLSFFNDYKNIDFFFKASYDKANRTSIDSYRGPGLEDGLKMLNSIKEKFGYKLLSDIHKEEEISPACEVLDAIQIPAFLSRQTDLVVNASKIAKKTNTKLNIKKGQFLSPKDMKHPVIKALKARNIKEEENTFDICQKEGIYVTERGASFGYSNLVVDMRAFPIMRDFAPTIFDATHSVAMPGGNGKSSSGDNTFVPYLSKAAAAAGVDGFFFETHYNPKEALSDASNMIKTDELQKLCDILIEINKIVKG